MQLRVVLLRFVFTLRSAGPSRQGFSGTQSVSFIVAHEQQPELQVEPVAQASLSTNSPQCVWLTRAHAPSNPRKPNPTTNDERQHCPQHKRKRVSQSVTEEERQERDRENKPLTEDKGRGSTAGRRQGRSREVSTSVGAGARASERLTFRLSSSLPHTLTHSLTHSFTHSHTASFVHSQSFRSQQTSGKS